MIRFWAEYHPKDARFRRLDAHVFERGMFGGGARPAPPPPPAPVTPMPDPEDPALLAAKRRAQEISRQRGGRASTVLSGDYSADKLGVD